MIIIRTEACSNLIILRQLCRLAYLRQLAAHYCSRIIHNFRVACIGFIGIYMSGPTRSMLPLKLTKGEISQFITVYHLTCQTARNYNQWPFYVYRWMVKAPRKGDSGCQYCYLLRVCTVRVDTSSDLPIQWEDFKFDILFDLPLNWDYIKISHRLHSELCDVGAELITSTEVKVSGPLNFLEQEICLPPDLDHATVFYSDFHHVYDDSTSTPHMYTITAWDSDCENSTVSHG